METLNYGRNKFYDTGPRLEKLARDKYSSLLQTLVNYGKKYITLAPEQDNFSYKLGQTSKYSL
jgi:hypothetical protein